MVMVARGCGGVVVAGLEGGREGVQWERNGVVVVAIPTASKTPQQQENSAEVCAWGARAASRLTLGHVTKPFFCRVEIPCPRPEQS